MNTYRLCTIAIPVLVLFVGVGCADSKNKKVDKPFEFQMAVQNFHRDMRWGEFGRASKATTDGFRQNFLGRYEERGDDYDIVNLEVENVERIEIDRRRVEVEQQWVVEPSMTVNKKTYVEIWTRAGDGWRIDDRMREREWERRKQQRTREDDSDSSTDDGTSASDDDKKSTSTTSRR